MRENHGLEGEDQLLISWLSVIGAIVMFWAPVERYIDQCVHMIHEGLEKKPKKPRNLQEKLKFVVKNFPATDFDVNSVKRLCEGTESTAKIRNVCVHGLMHEFDSNELKIGKVDGSKDAHVVEIFSFSSAQLERSASNLKVLQEEWRRLSLSILHSNGMRSTGG